MCRMCVCRVSWLPNFWLGQYGHLKDGIFYRLGSETEDLADRLGIEREAVELAVSKAKDSSNMEEGEVDNWIEW